MKADRAEAVINVAGGWAGGKASDPDWVKNADLMWKQSGECEGEGKSGQVSSVL